jgi:hypothetical protein
VANSASKVSTYDEEIIVIGDRETGELYQLKHAENASVEFIKLDERKLNSTSFEPPKNHVRSGGTLFRPGGNLGWEYQAPDGTWKSARFSPVINSFVRRVEKDGAGNIYGLDYHDRLKYFQTANGNKFQIILDQWMDRQFGGEVAQVAAIPDGAGVLLLGKDGKLVRLQIQPDPGLNPYQIGKFEVTKLADQVENMMQTGNNLIIGKKDGKWGFAPASHFMTGEAEFSKGFVDLSDQASKVFKGKIDFIGSNQRAGMFERIKIYMDGVSAMHDVQAEQLYSQIANRICGRGKPASGRDRKPSWQRRRPSS